MRQRNRKLPVLVFGLLIFLYGFFYSILQLQDYALLMGSLGGRKPNCRFRLFEAKWDFGEIQHLLLSTVRAAPDFGEVACLHDTV